VALVVVREDGAGIAPDDHVRIFARFTRTPGATGIVGTGLGLAIARELARTMGGDLDVASVEGHGSTFVLALPCGPTVTEQEVTAVLARALERETARLSVPAPPTTPWPSAAAYQLAVTRLSLAPAGHGLAALHTRRLRAVDGALAVAD
jgi:C4-dicarboxylate-specific signal transduction histidine kinase